MMGDDEVAAESSVGALVRRRLTGAYEVDPWGLDPDMIALLSPLLAARWSVVVHDADRVPDKGAAVVVHNRRFSLSAPFVVARGLHQASRRWVRVVGAPDIAPVGTVLRWFGAVPGAEDELASLLRADQVAAVPLAPELRHRFRAGAIDPQVLAPAVELGVPVVPVAMLGREIGRRWHLHVGEPVTPVPGAGPLAVAELAERARAGVQALLDELRPSRWIFG
jgi:hypothetical protein